MSIFFAIAIFIIYLIIIHFQLGKFLGLLLIFTFAGGTDIAAKVLNTQIEHSKLFAAKTIEVSNFTSQYNLLHQETNNGTEWINTHASEATITSTNKKCILAVRRSISTEIFATIQCKNKSIDSLTQLPITFNHIQKQKTIYTTQDLFPYIGNSLNIHSNTQKPFKLKDVFNYTFANFIQDIQKKDTLTINGNIHFLLKGSEITISNISLLAPIPKKRKLKYSSLLKEKTSQWSKIWDAVISVPILEMYHLKNID